MNINIIISVCVQFIDIGFIINACSYCVFEFKPNLFFDEHINVTLFAY